jgi:hypothetical protein
MLYRGGHERAQCNRRNSILDWHSISGSGRLPEELQTICEREKTKERMLNAFAAKARMRATPSIRSSVAIAARVLRLP